VNADYDYRCDQEEQGWFGEAITQTVKGHGKGKRDERLEERGM
jgi:hypothetical protein